MKIKYSIGFRIFFRLCWVIGCLFALAYIMTAGFFLENNGGVIAGIFLLAVVVQVIVLYMSLQRFTKKTHLPAQIIPMLVGFTLSIPFLLTGGCIAILSGMRIH